MWGMAREFSREINDATTRPTRAAGRERLNHWIHLHCVRWSAVWEGEDCCCNVVSGSRIERSTRASVFALGVKPFSGKGRVITKLRMNRHVFCIVKRSTMDQVMPFVVHAEATFSWCHLLSLMKHSILILMEGCVLIFTWFLWKVDKLSWFLFEIIFFENIL